MKRKKEYKITCKIFPTDIVQRVSRLHADLILTRPKITNIDPKMMDNKSSRSENQM